MAGLSDLMQYTPSGTGVTEGMKLGADIGQSQAAASYSNAMANRMNQMLPYDLSKAQYEQEVQNALDPSIMAQGQMGQAQQNQYAAKKAIEDYRRLPVEQQQKDIREVRESSNNFFNDFATHIISFGNRDAAAAAMASQSPMFADIIAGLKKDPQVWNRFTIDNALKRLQANPQYMQATAQGANRPLDPLAVAMEAARKELGPNASISDVAKLAFGMLSLRTPPGQPSVATTTDRLVRNPDGTFSLIREITKEPGAESAAAPAKPAAATPATPVVIPKGYKALGKAPPGTADGARTMGGKPVVVKGGIVYGE